jgi:hypothetical protein
MGQYSWWKAFCCKIFGHKFVDGRIDPIIIAKESQIWKKCYKCSLDEKL